MSRLFKLWMALMVLSSISLFSFAQVSEKNTESAFVFENVSSDDSSLSADESTITLDFDRAGDNNVGAADFSVFLVLRVIFVLVVIVALIYLLLFMLKKSVAVNPGDDKFLRQVASINIAPGKSVQVVTLTDKYAFLVGVADNSVNLISRIDDIELVQAMNLYSDSQKKSTKPKNFQDILDIFMPNGPKTEGGVFSGMKNQASEFLQRQRNHLNGGE